MWPAVHCPPHSPPSSIVSAGEGSWPEDPHRETTFARRMRWWMQSTPPIQNVGLIGNPKSAHGARATATEHTCMDARK